MRITVVGTGYVGLVTGACFAEMGNHVACVDIDEAKVARLRAGEIPIFEPGLEEMVARNAADGRLTFTTSLREALAGAEVCFIAVGTPPHEDGSADLTHVLTVARSIGEAIDGYVVVVDKSTVPVGTAERVREEIVPYLAKSEDRFFGSVIILIEDADIDSLKAAGWDDRAVYEATMLTSFFNMSGRVEAVSGLPPDEIPDHAQIAEARPDGLSAPISAAPGSG
jgi:threonine dehydrogenase-like Zn-dependent dehydrogenase